MRITALASRSGLSCAVDGTALSSGACSAQRPAPCAKFTADIADVLMQLRDLQKTCCGLGAYTVPFAAETSTFGKESMQIYTLRQGADANVTANMIATFMQVRHLQSSRRLGKVLPCSWMLQPVYPQQPYQPMMC